MVVSWLLGPSRGVRRAGRILAMVGAIGMWVPFALLSGLGVLAAITIGGIPSVDQPVFAFGFAAVSVIPVVTLLALRLGGLVAALGLALIGLALPQAWAPLVDPGASEPLHVITRVATVSGIAMALGGLLMLELPRRRARPRPPGRNAVGGEGLEQPTSSV